MQEMKIQLVKMLDFSVSEAYTLRVGRTVDAITAVQFEPGASALTEGRDHDEKGSRTVWQYGIQ